MQITYDEIGNPLTYNNGTAYTFTWKGRQLIGATKGGNTYSFTYNDNGDRTSKTKNGVTTTYYLNGSMIVAEETNGNVTVYLYDSIGTPIGIQYHAASYDDGVWDVYWFENNMQGDVVAVYNESGTKLVSYKYDAWGNFTTTYHNGGASTKAADNPFTYRGYYYDKDLELYYLGTRYYDSKICRFINADTTDILTATPYALTDKNLYAYCDNNPVMRVDQGGDFWNFIIGGAIGAIAGGVVAALNGEDWVGIIINSVAGAASGVVAASGLGLLAQAGVSAVISAAADAVNQSIDSIKNGNNVIDNYNITRTAKEATLGFVTSAIGSVAGKVFDNKVTKKLGISNELYDKYLEKSFSAALRSEQGKSTSALMRQANKMLAQSDFYLNVYRGISSAVGSSVSLWNLVR